MLRLAATILYYMNCHLYDDDDDGDDGDDDDTDNDDDGDGKDNNVDNDDDDDDDDVDNNDDVDNDDNNNDDVQLSRITTRQRVTKFTSLQAYVKHIDSSQKGMTKRFRNITHNNATYMRDSCTSTNTMLGWVAKTELQCIMTIYHNHMRTSVMKTSLQGHKHKQSLFYIQ
jgi:hypothetical protein